jgi:hypothetical protein
LKATMEMRKPTPAPPIFGPLTPSTLWTAVFLRPGRQG